MSDSSGAVADPEPLNLSPRAVAERYAGRVSFQVETEGEAIVQLLRQAAERNPTGPEARFSRQVRGLLDVVLREIRTLETQADAHPEGSPERQALERRIDERTRFFRNELAYGMVHLSKEIQRQRGGRAAFEQLRRRLPPYLRDCIQREGLVVPGVPGAVRPRTDNGVLRGPTGLDWRVRF